MDDEILARWIGGVDVTLQNLEKRFTEERYIAAADRAEIRLELKAFGIVQAETATLVRKMSPAVQEHTEHIHQAKGAARLAQIIGKAAPALAGAVGAALMWLFQWVAAGGKGPH